MPLQCLLQEGQSCSLVAGFGDVALEYLALLIHRPPQIMALAVDLDEHFIKVPAPLTKSTHPADTLAPDLCREHRSEPVPPQPHRLVADVDAALGEQVLDVAQGQRKTDIHQHRQPNDLRRGVEIPERVG